MGLKNFDTFYINGCSHTAGGGLSEFMIKDEYKRLHGVEWKSERDVTFSKYISNYFNVKRVDDSTQGSGSPRLVRKTFEYINKVGVENIKDTLFILQINNSINRVEIFCKKINDYVVVNVVYNDDGTFRYFDVVENWSQTERKYELSYFENEIKDDISHILQNYHDPMVYQLKIQCEMIGLFSFFEKNDIEYIVLMDDRHYLGEFKNLYKDRVVEIDGAFSAHEYTTQKNMRILDELPGITQDCHPGYFGHKKYSEVLIKYLEEKYS